MMRNKMFGHVLLLALTLSLFSLSGLAVSITPGMIRMDFVPGAEFDFEYTVARFEKIDVYIDDGDLPGVATLYDPTPNGTARTVKVHVKLPARIEQPGKNALYVVAKEVPLNPYGVNALTSIRSPIVVNVPYPGYYADMDFESPNVNEGETATFKVTVINRGSNSLRNAIATIDIYDKETGQLIKSASTDSSYVGVGETVVLYAGMSTSGINPGEYRAEATLFFDGDNSVTNEKPFNVGSLFVAVKDFTRVLEVGGIRKFDVDVESRWNNKIDEVYAIVEFEGTSSKTPSEALEPWSQKKLSTYIDTSNHNYGNHNIMITLHYGGKTTLMPGRVDLVQEGTLSAAPKPDGVKKPFFTIEFTPVTILIIVIVILVLFDVIWLLLRNRKGRNEPESKDLVEMHNHEAVPHMHHSEQVVDKEGLEDRVQNKMKKKDKPKKAAKKRSKR